ELDIAYTGSDAYSLAVTSDRSLTKTIRAGHGVRSPRDRFRTRHSLGGGGLDESVCSVSVKPSFEGGSPAIGDTTVADRPIRLGRDGEIYFLEVNALPSLEPGAGLFVAAQRAGLDYAQTVQKVIASAATRSGLSALLDTRNAPKKRRKGLGPYRVGFIYNVKRLHPGEDGSLDQEAEFDPPETIDAIKGAIESHRHPVLTLEATSDY